MLRLSSLPTMIYAKTHQEQYVEIVLPSTFETFLVLTQGVGFIE
ncbi:hypothetical protein PNU84_04920 [Turicibacter sanguinis]|nr:hypothetical protein [Turicibacter sanguinis]